MNPCELTMSVTLLANQIATALTIDELNLWSSIFNQLGDTLGVIAAQRDLCSALASNNKEDEALPDSDANTDSGTDQKQTSDQQTDSQKANANKKEATSNT